MKLRQEDQKPTQQSTTPPEPWVIKSRHRYLVEQGRLTAPGIVYTDQTVWFDIARPGKKKDTRKAERKKGYEH